MAPKKQKVASKPEFELAPGKFVGGDHPCFVLAEAGINHQGRVDLAKELIKVAKEQGADGVKFQKRNVDRILTAEGLAKPYDNANSFAPEGDRTYGAHKRALELDFDAWREMKAYADEIGILFTASGWDEDSVDFLDALGVPFFKMASADLTNYPLLEHTAKKGKPMIISSGMVDMATVEGAVGFLKQFTSNIVLLQCTSTYPCKAETVNLRVMETYRQTFPDVVIGYSGHENGIAISTAAATMGAKLIERHFTLDRTWKGGDHAASLEPTGLGKLIRDIHTVEEALGDGVKVQQPGEQAVLVKLAKSIVSAVDIPAGTTLTREMLTTKGPGDGIGPMRMAEVVGKKTTRAIKADCKMVDADVAW